MKAQPCCVLDCGTDAIARSVGRTTGLVRRSRIGSIVCPSTYVIMDAAKKPEVGYALVQRVGCGIDLIR